MSVPGQPIKSPGAFSMNATAVRRVATKITLPTRHVGEGFQVRRLGANELPSSALDPVLQADLFTMNMPFFKPHCHAGFNAITYLLTDSKGAVTNRDSKGTDMSIRPGSLHWTCAGRGIIHEEVPKPGVEAHGLQLFVNLPSDLKMMEPQALHVDTEDVPEVTLPQGGRVRVLTGSTGSVSAKVQTPVPFTFLDVRLAAGDQFSHATPDGDNVSLFMLSGAASLGPGADASATHLDGDDFAVLGHGGTVEVMADADGPGAEFLLLQGTPAGTPVVWGGSICMDSQERMQDRRRAYEAGEMGTLAPSETTWAKR